MGHCGMSFFNILSYDFIFRILVNTILFAPYFMQSPTPAPFVKEMKDAGMFYGNRVLKDFKDR